MRDALIVFAKVPRPGSVKTRLSPPLAEVEAAELYEAFLLDSLEQYDKLTAETRLYLADRPVADELAAVAVEFHNQSGSGLGEKMLNAFQETFAAGYERACIIGTDHPTLPLKHIESAFRALETCDVAVGPSADGGYYLLSMRESHAAVFSAMTYSHPRVFADTRERAEGAGLVLNILPEWYDVDDRDGLARLIVELPETQIPLSRTRHVVDTLFHRHSELADYRKRP